MGWVTHGDKKKKKEYEHPQCQGMVDNMSELSTCLVLWGPLAYSA